MKKNIIPLLAAFAMHYTKPKAKKFDPKKKCGSCIFYKEKICEKTGLKMSEEGGLYCPNFIKKLI